MAAFCIDGRCPIEDTLNVIAGRWKILILWWLQEGELRFSVIFALLTWNIAQFREDFWAATFEPRSYRRKQRELTQKATKDTKRLGTNSEGPVKYCRCTFFGHATRGSRRSASRVQCGVARCDMGLPTHTSHPIWRLSRGPFLRQSGVVTETNS